MCRWMTRRTTSQSLPLRSGSGHGAPAGCPAWAGAAPPAAGAPVSATTATPSASAARPIARRSLDAKPVHQIAQHRRDGPLALLAKFVVARDRPQRILVGDEVR